MLSPTGTFQNIGKFSRMLARVGDNPQKPTTQPKNQTGGAQAPVDSFEPSKKDLQKQKISAALEGNPEATAALEKLDRRGKLDAKAAGKTTLADQLARMSGNPELLGQVVQDLASPGKIEQGKNNKFCAATSSLQEMARQDPGNYARVAADLSLTGSSKVQNGVTLKAQTDLDESKMGSMSATQKLMAPAVAEYANGTGMEVSETGVSTATDNRKEDRRVAGTVSTGRERMQQALVGDDWDSQYIDDSSKKERKESVDSAQSTIRQNLKAGEHPSVSHNGHWYNVTGFRATPDGGRMTLQDPLTGESKTVNARNFLNKAEAVTFDKTETGKKPDAEQLARPKDEKPGGGGKGALSGNPVEDRL